jgi:protein-S-isoprenylcysteine O-methyltransferase Ste14
LSGLVEMDPLRLYLLAGLIAHKLLWEAMKRRIPRPPRETRPATLLLKAVKVAVLCGLIAQTLLPEILPIRQDAGLLRIAGAALFTLGLAAAMSARVSLGDSWTDLESSEVRRSSGVVCGGLYRFIRHPIYSGDLILLYGFELALNSWLVAGVALMTPYVIARAIGEERMLAAALPGYDDYCRSTKRFIPFLF